MKLHLLQDDAQVSPQHDLLCLANTGSFNNTYFSEALTSYAVGWRDPSNLGEIMDFLFPPVQVARRFEYRAATNGEAFLTESDDERAIGADFKRVKYTGTIQNSKILNRGLTLFVDLDEIGDEPNWEQTRVDRLLRRSRRNDLITAIGLMVAGASNTAKTWDSSADPDADLMDLISASGDAIGFDPNRLALLGASWAKRVQAFRAQDNAGAYASSMMSPEQLAAFLAIEEARVVGARYQTSSTGSKSKVGGGNYVVAFYAEAGLGPEDPSNCKRFWTPCGDGSEYRVYRREVSEKLVALTVERYNRMVVTSTIGLRKYTIS